jgi:hypothetical protein
MELAEYFDDVAGEYARLLLLLDMARAKAHELGETEMIADLSLMVDAASERLMELTDELSARRIAPGME